MEKCAQEVVVIYICTTGTPYHMKGKKEHYLKEMSHGSFLSSAS